MSALKHMELIFGVVVVAGCIAAALPAGGAAQVQAQPEAVRSQALPSGIPVVVVKGKRMSTLEKRASLGAAPAVRRDGATGT
jgi:hypothetical protein